MQKPSPMDRIVVINYPVGCFGSFLMHCLHHSNSTYYKLPNSDVFVNSGAAHNHINEFFYSFHDPRSLQDWLIKPEEVRYDLLNQYWNPPKEFTTSKLYYVHRLTLPKYNNIFKKHFPTSKFVKITVDDSEIDFLANVFCKKIPYDYNNKPNVPSKKKNYFKWTRNNDAENDVYDFNVKHFINGTFTSEFNKLCEWLNFEKVDDIDVFYERFKKVNEIS